jgi:PPOX class probable F420-dependent enzyme
VSRMEKAALDAFLSVPRIGKLVTLRPDGSPTVVPIWFDWDGATATIFTSRTSPKVRRITAEPRVALSVEEPVGVSEAWVTLEGTATIEQEGGLALARKLIDRYYTAERVAEVWPSWEESGDSWVVIRITPSRIESMGS